MPTPEAHFGWKDVGVIAMVLVFGGLGYLCDIHSPLAAPAIPFFGAFFLFALLALGGLCAYQFVSQSTVGWLVGLALIASIASVVLWRVFGIERS